MSSVKFDGFWSTVKARELLPPCPPPDPGPLPALPSESPARSSDFGHGFTLSTHLSPGAFPRSTPFFPAYPQTPDNESKEERQNRVTRQGKELFELRQKYGRGELDGMEKNRNVVWTCFNRYVRQGVEVESKMGRRSLTLFLAHANGMHKETFEPMLHRLLALNEKDQAYRIDEIWTYDAPQHGDSALINGDKLGCLYDWIDNTRDILNFFLHYLPETVSSTPLSTHLPEVPKLATARRKAEGFTSRNLIAVGHSFGGASLTVAAYHVPAIFSGLVLIDPVIAPAPPSMDRSKALFAYVTSSFARRISWPNREEAYKLLKASPFFSSWHDDVLRHYVQHGMTETKDGPVRLKCTGYDEAYVFADHYTSWEAFSILPNIDVRIPIKWINPPAGPSIATREEVAQARIWRRPSNTTSVVIEKALHLVVQDSPDEVATEIHKYLIPIGSHSQKARL